MDRQKKLLIFAAAWVSAGLLTWFCTPRPSRRSRRSRRRCWWPARHAGRHPAEGERSEAGELPRAKHSRRASLTDPKDAVNRVLLVPISSNEPVLASKLSAATTVEGMASTIDPGFRAVSVQITDASGVAGLVQPNAHVDVLFTRPGIDGGSDHVDDPRKRQGALDGPAIADRDRRWIRARRGRRWSRCC